MEKEVWKSLNGVVENGDNYSVSTMGRVKITDSGRILKHNLNTRGYHSVALSLNATKKRYRVHRLVAAAFIPNPDEKPQVNHKDGNKDNNCESNLEWATSSENIKHAFATGLNDVKGENSCVNILTAKDVVEIKKLLRDGVVGKDIASKFGISRQSITQIKTGRQWSHIKVDGFVENSKRNPIGTSGINNANSKLSEDIVRKIREMHKTGKYTLSQISNEFGVPTGSLSNIIHRRTWKHVS